MWVWCGVWHEQRVRHEHTCRCVGQMLPQALTKSADFRHCALEIGEMGLSWLMHSEKFRAWFDLGFEVGERKTTHRNCHVVQVHKSSRRAISNGAPT